MTSCRRRRSACGMIQGVAGITLKTVNDELARRGFQALLTKGSGYFYFRDGEAAEWLDRTVKVRKINNLTLKQWIEEFRRLKELNEQILRTGRNQKP